MKDNKTFSLFVVLLIYTTAIIVTYFLWPVFQSYHLFFQVLFADIVATVIVFAGSVFTRNSSMYDPYWSVAPPIIAIVLIQHFPEGNNFRQVLLFIAVLAWSVRLTLNWIRGWKGLNHEDWRYEDIRKKAGKWYWPTSFGGIHLLPTLWVYLGCLPMFYAIRDTTQVGIFDLLGFVICLAATLIEWVADEQMKKFKKKYPSGTSIKTGLWKYSRHPNYFGETLFWVGIFVFALSYPAGQALWTAVGVVLMYVLFFFISIPMMDKRNLAKRKDYASVMAEIPGLFPTPKAFKKRATH